MNYHCTGVLALLIFSCLPLSGQATVKTENYPAGQPKIYAEQIAGLADGMWYEWYPNGQLRYRARWRKGKGHGEWEYFYENGQLRSHTVYAEDQPQGVERQYYPNGQLSSETIYVNGRRHGERREFDDRGNQTSRQLYLDGDKILNRPVLFAPGVISNPNSSEWRPAFSSDGKTVYFTRRDKDGEPQKIYESTLVDNRWQTPEILPFSTDTDESPVLSKDGTTMYFASYRPIPGRPPLTKYDMNLWRVERQAAGWGVPEPLPPTINGIVGTDDKWPYGYEAGPWLDNDGNLLYWTSLVPDGEPKVVMAPVLSSGNFGPPALVPDINSKKSDSGATISPDGRYIVWSSYQREDGFGQEDLYFARKTATGWGEAVNLGPIINSTANEGGACFSPDGKLFYFCSGRNDNQSDIYYMEAKYLFE